MASGADEVQAAKLLLSQPGQAAGSMVMRALEKFIPWRKQGGLPRRARTRQPRSSTRRPLPPLQPPSAAAACRTASGLTPPGSRRSSARSTSSAASSRTGPSSPAWPSRNCARPSSARTTCGSMMPLPPPEAFSTAPCFRTVAIYYRGHPDQPGRAAPRMYQARSQAYSRVQWVCQHIRSRLPRSHCCLDTLPSLVRATPYICKDSSASAACPARTR